MKTFSPIFEGRSSVPIDECGRALPDQNNGLRIEPLRIAQLPLSEAELRIHERASRAAFEFRRAEAELMEALIAVDDAKIHSRIGYPSLFQYAIGALALTEAVAYAAISVARKAALVPELRLAVGSGKLGLSKAKKILSVLDSKAPPENRAAWVEKAVSLPSRKLERAVAKENPREAVSERVVYRSSDRIELTIGISEALMLDFRQAQNLVSTSRVGPADLEETLAEMLRFYLERKDPERRAKRIFAKKGSGETAVPNPERFTGTVQISKTEISPSRRKALPASLVHQVRLRDGNRCRAMLPDGTPCGSKRWLDIHHRVPISAGGEDRLENLVVLCRAHHQEYHRTRRAMNSWS